MSDYNKEFWDNLLNKEVKNRVIVKGQHFTHRGFKDLSKCTHLKRRAEESFLGHGGRLFKIKMLSDGQIVETNDLWYQGEIPQEYRDRFPDNAEFVKEERKIDPNSPF